MINFNSNIIEAQRDKVERNSPVYPYGDYPAQLLVVAGGGAGSVDIGGGGGAGGYNKSGSLYVDNKDVYTVIVGAGANSYYARTGGVCDADPGAGNSKSGSNSEFISQQTGYNYFTMGGGNGGCGLTKAGSKGGSGGGASLGGVPLQGSGGGSAYVPQPPASWNPQGYKGGDTANEPNRKGGGGGGASEEGGRSASSNGEVGYGGDGLPGIGFLTGSYFAGGGAGSGWESAGSALGGGGVAASSPPTGSHNGQPNTGGGGGALTGVRGEFTPDYDSGKGGSGIVIVFYEGNPRAYGGQMTTMDIAGVPHTQHVYTSSGLFEPVNV